MKHYVIFNLRRLVQWDERRVDAQFSIVVNQLLTEMFNSNCIKFYKMGLWIDFFEYEKIILKLDKDIHLIINTILAQCTATLKNYFLTDDVNKSTLNIVI